MGVGGGWRGEGGGGDSVSLEFYPLYHVDTEILIYNNRIFIVPNFIHD